MDLIFTIVDATLKADQVGNSSLLKCMQVLHNYCKKLLPICTVYYAPLGMWASAKDLFDNGQEEDCLRYAAKTMDMVYKDLLKTKHQNFVCIVDIAGATYRKALHELQNFKGLIILNMQNISIIQLIKFFAGIQDLIWVFKE